MDKILDIMENVTLLSAVTYGLEIVIIFCKMPERQ